MRHLIMPLLAAAAIVLYTSAAQADLGDQLFKLLPNDGAVDDRFGFSVAISGTTAIVGAADAGSFAGWAYLFDAGAPGNCPWDVNGDGVVNGADVAEVATHFGPCP